MKSGDFMKALAFVAGGALSAAPALADNLLVAHGYAPAHMITQHGIEPWMACVREATGGDVEFQHMAAGQVVNFNGAMDALDQGLAQVSVVLLASASNRLPLNGIALLPGLGDSSQEMVAAYRNALDAEGPIRDEMAASGLRPVLVNLLPPYQIVATSEPVDSIERFKGLKVRVGGGAMNMTMNALGASPVEIGGGEMYVAMERGTVDATILTLSSIKTYGLQDIVRSISGNASLGSGATVLAMSEKVWNGLAPDMQNAVDDCGRTVEATLAQALDAADVELKAEFVALGIEVYDLVPEENGRIAEALEVATADYVQRLQARGLPAEEAHAAYLSGLGR
ncbi:TRAP transporter substrate-binding protein DctP [Paracoccus sp. (in: a-proteobacteria)]|uniref:TRAP transporter substrate-binding protein n=1 Tax=Paracoccus sp. TaxID=267 RepID=UPI002B0027F4|nr:TRAP transporter substrate-binding protein DctP [Paracoccus sp. (in: a-proteobacteria)]